MAQRPALRHPGPPTSVLRVWDQWTLTPFLGLPGNEGPLLLLGLRTPPGALLEVLKLFSDATQ